jgi:hypothetical protein
MWRWTVQDKMLGHLFLVVVGGATLIVCLGLRVIGLL